MTSSRTSSGDIFTNGFVSNAINGSFAKVLDESFAVSEGLDVICAAELSGVSDCMLTDMGDDGGVRSDGTEKVRVGCEETWGGGGDFRVR